jgi:hypothetical protein
MGHENDTLDKVVDHLKLEVHEIGEHKFYLHHDDVLLLDATLLQLIFLGQVKLYSIFHEFPDINGVIISSTNLSMAGELLCKVIRDMLTSNIKKLQIVNCELPSSVREKDLKILEINSRSHQFDTFEVIDWEIYRREKRVLKKIVESISQDSPMYFSIQSESDT